MTEDTIIIDEISPLELFGVHNTRFRQLKEHYPDLVFIARGHELKFRGPENEISEAKMVLARIVDVIRKRGTISDEKFGEMLYTQAAPKSQLEVHSEEDVLVHGSRGKSIVPKTEGQRRLIKAAEENDIVFAIGPAGTGKTYIAVAIAVKALKEKRVRKIFLVRPAVEAGEQLGFLPGDLKEKVDPYLRPLYDALEDMIQYDKLKNYLDKNIIEIAPLAYMRGRTLSDAFVILDEAQNATQAQFKMFLTRLGKGSRIIVTGDDTQIDLPRKMSSGLLQATRILKNIRGIEFVKLNPSDVVRHKLVKNIIAAYQTESEKNNDRHPDEGKIL